MTNHRNEGRATVGPSDGTPPDERGDGHLSGIAAMNGHDGPDSGNSFDAAKVARFARFRPGEQRSTMDGEDIDLVRAERAVADLLDALRVDRRTESLRDTPARVARAYAELLTAEPFEATTFPNDEGYDELVVAREIAFSPHPVRVLVARRTPRVRGTSPSLTGAIATLSTPPGGRGGRGVSPAAAGPAA